MVPLIVKPLLSLPIPLLVLTLLQFLTALLELQIEAFVLELVGGAALLGYLHVELPVHSLKFFAFELGLLFSGFNRPIGFSHALLRGANVLLDDFPFRRLALSVAAHVTEELRLQFLFLLLFIYLLLQLLVLLHHLQLLKLLVLELLDALGLLVLCIFARHLIC